MREFVDKSFSKKVTAVRSFKGFNKPVLKIFSRASVVTTAFLDLHVDIFNGKKFIRVRILPAMVGHKFGEFAFTRRMGLSIHKEKSKKKS
jgi:small subunit ribosomal protein S19